MELIRGGTLTEFLQKTKNPPEN